LYSIIVVTEVGDNLTCTYNSLAKPLSYMASFTASVMTYALPYEAF